MTLLPQELQDKIFLYLDYDTLKNCRELQSDFVKFTTQYSNYNDAIEGDNLKALKWLKEKGDTWNRYTYTIALENGNREILEWLEDQGCEDQGHGNLELTHFMILSPPSVYT
jgi:hypothetical protein